MAFELRCFIYQNLGSTDHMYPKKVGVRQIDTITFVLEDISVILLVFNV